MEGTLISGMSALIKKKTRELVGSIFCVCEDITRSWQFSTQKKAPNHVGTLILDFIASLWNSVIATYAKTFGDLL